MRQKARWRVGPASGVASVTVRACVDDKRQTACFELVNGSCDADASSFVTERTSDAKNAPQLAAYGGVLGCEVGGRNTRVYLRGVAIVAPNASGIARGVATRFAARILRKQTRRSIADIAANAEARARSRDDAARAQINVSTVLIRRADGRRAPKRTKDAKDAKDALQNIMTY